LGGDFNQLARIPKRTVVHGSDFGDQFDLHDGV
jgi:hypothetical protein